MRIKHTKLIYCYDTLNKVNFHQYIDNVSSLLLVLKTAAGMFVAAYSEGPFLRRTSDRDGIIFSLTNRKFFTPV
jgi:NADH:ubiquinone oxidoreductase subunit 5 (subunit L)/multisubunit Na+/H+ antiporter MnhA subunit